MKEELGLLPIIGLTTSNDKLFNGMVTRRRAGFVACNLVDDQPRQTIQRNGYTEKSWRRAGFIACNRLTTSHDNLFNGMVTQRRAGFIACNRLTTSNDKLFNGMVTQRRAGFVAYSRVDDQQRQTIQRNGYTEKSWVVQNCRGVERVILQDHLITSRSHAT
ncbi:hypothetical protein J6590_026371 [Homalodisca vitripennis]|nr:hypothetical protein J6590_026371 [Homalodisca vitripennis]